MSLRSRLWTVLRHPTSLKARAVNAGLWTIAGMAVQHPLRLVSNLIMTRLVEPEAFGLMATVIVLHVGLAMISDVGIAQSVIRDPRGGEPEYLRVAWVVQILRALVMAGLLVPIGFGVWLFGAGLEGTVYADPALPWMIWGSTLVVIAKGFESTLVLLAGKALRIARVTLMDIATQLAGLAVMIGLGLAGAGVWALFAGLVAGALARLVLSHTVLSGPRMAFAWNRAQVAEMWTFGKWLIGSSLAGYFLNNGDRLVFGMLMDARTFGLYAIAALWVGAATDLLSRLMGGLTTPAFSELRNRGVADLEVLMQRVVLAMVAVSSLAAVLMVILSGALIEILYDETYRGAGALLALLSLRVMLIGWQPMTATVLAAGESRVLFISLLIGGIASLVLPLLMYRHVGLVLAIPAAAIALALANLVLLGLAGETLRQGRLLNMGLITCQSLLIMMVAITGILP